MSPPRRYACMLLFSNTRFCYFWPCAPWTPGEKKNRRFPSLAATLACYGFPILDVSLFLIICAKDPRGGVCPLAVTLACYCSPIQDFAMLLQFAPKTPGEKKHPRFFPRAATLALYCFPILDCVILGHLHLGPKGRRKIIDFPPSPPRLHFTVFQY